MKTHALSIALALVLSTLNSQVIAQTDRPKELEFYGVVRTANGQPVSNCELTITAPSSNRFERFFAREAIAMAPEKLTTSTGSDGNFKFRIDLTNKKWNGSGEGLIIARGAAGEFAVQTYRLARGLIDLPVDLSLAPSTQSSVRILNNAGQALTGVRVTPARYGKINVPFAIAEGLGSTSNQDGEVELPATTQPLTAVFVTGENLGHQFLLTKNNASGKLETVVLSTAPRRMRCLPPEDAKPTDIGRIDWAIVSFQKSNDQMELAWQRVATNGVDPVTVALPEGSLVGFNDVRSGHGWLPADRGFELTDQTDIDLKLQRAIHATGRVVAKENGQPLAGICLQESHSDGTVLTGDDGAFDMWLPTVSDGTYPIDPLEQYFSEQAFYERPEAEHAPGEAKFKPFELTRSSSTVGTVLDANGKPLAGVTVKCESKQERFTNTVDLLSDRHGAFRMNNIADGTPVKLKVMDLRGVTESPLEVTVNPNESPVIRLAKPAPKRFLGRIVDTHGQPIAGATVEVQLGRVIIEENYRPAEYTMENAFDQPTAKRSRFTTDANGRFESDDCIDWQNVFLLKLNHPQHYETLSWVRRVDKTPASEPTYDFGDVRMRATPPPQKFTVQLKDKSGATISDAKILFIQGRDFADQATTDSNGQASFDGKRAAAVVAARIQQRVAFATIAGDQAQVTLNMDAISEDQTWNAFPVSLAERRALIGKMLKKFELAQTLDLSKASDIEVANILDAVLFANPTAVIQLATQKRAELEKRPQAAAMLIQSAIGHNSSLGPSLLPFMPHEYQHYMSLDLASKTTDETARQEHLAQALALTRKLQGDEAATGTGRLAMHLLQTGDVELATELVNEIYDNQKNDFEAAADQKSKRGVARYFYPQLALVNFDVACQLIHKHAYANEIETLQTLALALAVVAEKTDWKMGLSKLGRSSLADQESSLVPGAFGEMPLPNDKFVEALLEQIGSEKIKALLCIQAAIKLPNVADDVRKKWLNRGAQFLVKAKNEYPSFYSETLAYRLREHLPKLGKIDPVATRQIVFVCLEEISEFRDGEYFYLPDRAGFVAEALAGIDSKLSRTLLQPFLDDFSWHYRAGFRFGPNALTSAAKIDPDLAVTVAQQLIDGDLRDDKLRQAEVLKSVVDGLAQ